MKSRTSHLNIWYNADVGNLGPFTSMTNYAVKKNITQANFKYKKEDIAVHSPEDKKTTYYFVIPESSPYFNLPLLVSKMYIIPGGESNYQYFEPIVMQFIDEIIK